MAALVRAHGDALDVFSNGGVYDFIDGPVVAQVDNLGTLSLEEPADDVDGGVVAVEQARRRDKAHRVGGNVEGRLTRG